MGSALLLETLNQRIRGAEALSIAIRQRPLGIIPYITLDSEIAGRKRLLKKAAIVTAVVLLIVTILLHFIYMPLDILWLKVISRFG